MKQFNDYYVEQFIRDLANCTDNCPSIQMWLEDQGVDGVDPEASDMLRTMCNTWIVNKELIYNAAYSTFWQYMKFLAGMRFDAELND